MRKGSHVYYKGKPCVIGDVIRSDNENDIEKISICHMCSIETTEIELEDINSMLIWRVAYEIVKYM